MPLAEVGGEMVSTELMQLRGNITLLTIAHRLSTIEKADQILVLHHGELVRQELHQVLIGQAWNLPTPL